MCAVDSHVHVSCSGQKMTHWRQMSSRTSFWGLWVSQSFVHTPVYLTGAPLGEGWEYSDTAFDTNWCDHKT